MEDNSPYIDSKGLKEDKPECCCNTLDKNTFRSDKMKSSLCNRLNRVEGQIRGIKGMIEKDIYCDDVINQIFAVQSAMKSIELILLENHMKTCIVKHVQSGEMEILDELLQTIEKLVK